MPPRARGGGTTGSGHDRGGQTSGEGGTTGSRDGSGSTSSRPSPTGGASSLDGQQANLRSSATTRRPRARQTRAGPAGPSTRGGMVGVIDAANGIGQQYRGPAHLAQNVTQVRHENAGRSGGTANPALDHPAPNTAYVVNGRHLYITDEHGRTAYAQTRITPGLPEGARNNYRQGQSGRSGRSGDDGMHFVGTQFDGPLERINYNPGAVAMNRGSPGYAEHETAWAAAAGRGDTVDVAITPQFQPTGSNPRPIRWNGETSVNGGDWTPLNEYNPSHSRPGYGTNPNYVPRHLEP